MRTKTIREWTYEEVRRALEKIYGPIEGIKLNMVTGYMVEECPVNEEPTSASENPVNEIKPPPF